MQAGHSTDAGHNNLKTIMTIKRHEDLRVNLILANLIRSWDFSLFLIKAANGATLLLTLKRNKKILNSNLRHTGSQCIDLQIGEFELFFRSLSAHMYLTLVVIVIHSSIAQTK